MQNRVSSPPIPYVGPIYGQLSPGKIIRIQGNCPTSANRFNINLQCGPRVQPSDEIALHMAVHLQYDYIARNSYHMDGWDEEQNTGILPIKRGQQFEILILCEQNAYKIAINGQHFCEFPHRIQFQRVSHIAIDGDVFIGQIGFEGGPSYGPPPTFGAPSSGNMVSFPPIPYSGLIPGGSVPGKNIKICGTVPQMANRFNINLQCGPSNQPNVEIGLHMAVHLQYNYIARNSYHLDGWDEEQSDGPLRIQRGQPFEIFIRLEHSSYKIAINGQHFCDFPVRIPLQNITYLAIDGEVSVSQITFEGGSQQPGMAPPYAPQPGGFPPGMQPFGPPPGMSPFGSGPPPCGPPPCGPPPSYGATQFGGPGAPPYGGQPGAYGSQPPPYGNPSAPPPF